MSDIKIDYTREELIELCKRAFVKQDKWQNRDSCSAQVQIVTALLFLEAGCKFVILHENIRGTPFNAVSTTRDFIYVLFYVKDFIWFDMLDADEEEFPDGSQYGSYFYIPTEKTLEKAAGNDWYKI